MKFEPAQKSKTRGLPSLPESYPAPKAYPIRLPVHEIASEPVRIYLPGTRMLRDIPRGEQRILECRLASMRREPVKSDEEISAALNIHPGQIDALAATHGQL